MENFKTQAQEMFKQNNLDIASDSGFNAKPNNHKPIQKVSDFESTEKLINNRMLSKPVEQEAEILNKQVHENSELEGFYNEQMVRTWSPIQKFTNRKMYDVVQHVKQDLIKQSAEYRIAYYKTILNARIGALVEHCDSGLAAIQGHYRAHLTSYLMSKMEEMATEVKQRQFRFLEMMKGKYQYAVTLKEYPSMHKRYVENIMSEEARYLKFLDGLLEHFGNIVENKINHYKS
jgi:hypothetical protein